MFLGLFLAVLASVAAAEELYAVEGRVLAPEDEFAANWQRDTRVLLNGGEYIGFLK
jgi:hypothetical protein